MAEIPAAITCAACGSPLRALTSYSVSVPLNGPVRPADLCDPQCLLDWAETLVRQRDKRRADA